MKRRVLQRSRDLSPGVSVIDEAAFKLLKNCFEPLSDDEPHIFVPSDVS